MRRKRYQFFILGGVIVLLIAAAAVLWTVQQSKEESVTYSSLEEATLPVVTLETDGVSVNILYGYVSEMDAASLQDSVTPVSDDGDLSFSVILYDNTVTEITYAVTSLDGEENITSGRLSAWETGEDSLDAVLSFGEALTEGEEYALVITLATGQQEAVHYYCRIVQNEDLNTEEMLEFVLDMHEASFDETEAEDYSSYWEGEDSSAVSTLTLVEIDSDFGQFTWGDLSPTQIGETQVTILELDENFGSFLLIYLVEAEDGDGNTGTYLAEEFFCVQWSSLRLYLMTYQRTLKQVFAGSEVTFTGDTIEFGVVDEEDVALTESPDGTVVAFAVDGALWSWCAEDAEAVQIFSFGEADASDLRTLKREYTIHIVDVDDEGNIEFLVCGYMSQGSHEGRTGLAYYQYVSEDQALQEIFFLSSDKAYEILEADLEILAHKENSLFYFLFDNTVCCVDTALQEVSVIVENADACSLVVSEDQTAVAWQQGEDPDQADSLVILYLDSGETQELTAESGEYLRVQGFIGEDFVYTIGRVSDIQMEGFETLYPQYALAIINPEGGEEARYEYNNVYLSEVTVSSGQVHLSRAAKTDDGSYEALDDDILMQNSTDTGDETLSLTSRTDDLRQRVWYLSLSATTEEEIAFSAAEGVLYQTDTVLSISGTEETALRYFAYSCGTLEGIYEEAGDAILAIYSDMGWVTDSLGHRVWHRTSKGTLSVSLAIDEEGAAVSSSASRMAGCLNAILLWEGADADAAELLAEGLSAYEILEQELGVSAEDLTGCTLSQLYYFLRKGTPVIVLSTDDTPLLLVGFDTYNIEVYDPLTGTVSKMGQQDATDTFEEAGNRFLGYVK